jgi:hypothetical protein
VGTATLSLRIGKLTVRNPVYPYEPGFVNSIRSQMKELADIISSAFDQMENASPILIKNALEPTFEKSQMYCPVDTGDMLASGYLEAVDTSKGNVRVEMGYGKGGNPPYTVYVHEVPHYHKPPTRWKWLQAAVNEDMPDMLGRLQAEYANFMGMGLSG